MSHIFRDSFDFYSNGSNASGHWDSIGNGSVSTNTRFGVGRSYTPSTTLGQVGLVKAFGRNTTNTFFFTASIGQYSFPSASSPTQILRFYDGATVQCSALFDENGDIRFYRGDASTLLGTWVGGWRGAPSGLWDRHEWKIIFGSGTSGEFHCRRNGNTSDDYTLTGINLMTTANAYINKMDTRCGASASRNVYFDDLWIYDSTVAAGEPSDWIGDVKAVQIMPTGDVSTGWTRSTGATNYGCVDEAINSATDYVSGSSAALVDQYSNSGFTTAPATILGVAVRIIGAKMDAGARTVGTRLISGGTTVDSTGVAISTSAQCIVSDFHVDPNTSATWSAAAVAAATFGPRIIT